VTAGLILVPLLTTNFAAPQPPIHEAFWGKTVLKKRREQTRHLGGGFEFRSVAYYIDCSGGCFENPWHIGEFWYRDRMLTRGIEDTDVSVSPSKRFAAFHDRETRGLRLFDSSRAQTDENPSTDGEVKNFTWDEPKHVLKVDFFNHPPSEIKLPE
jgi:hypothetical protein